ncbi:MAG: isoprenylcysteine carboxylmethyltransferase family protein [Casimicrobiaceae bacterium]
MKDNDGKERLAAGETIADDALSTMDYCVEGVQPSGHPIATMQKRRILPPVYFLAAIVVMVALDFVLPMVRWHWSPARMAGVVLIVAGLASAIAGARRFRLHGTAVKPFAESSALVVDGPYRFTRNPMYLGLSIILLGIGLVLESLTPFLVIPVFVWLITTRFIALEEPMLEQRFGSAYVEYRARVRRWL